LEYLFKIELYFCLSVSKDGKSFYLIDKEFYHAVKVMRNKIGNKIFATDGYGNIFEGLISEINKGSLIANIIKTNNYKNELDNFIFCIPNLKNSERLKFALEKCTELGITRFILFNSERTVSKGFNSDRLNKIVISAMKQSLRAFLPEIEIANSIKELKNFGGEKILFDQFSLNKLSETNFDRSKNYLMIFGPEGGLTDKEIQEINPLKKFRLSGNRLRSETAIIKAASVIS
jgi:16S rRNA (uracil1498-N3)-methyltransferase